LTTSTDTVIARSREQAVDLIAELDRRRQSARDIVIDAGRLDHGVNISPDGKASYRLGVPFVGDAFEGFPLSPTALGQVAQAASIPGDYAKRIHGDYPLLFADSVATLLPKDKARMVRSLDGRVRAFLSDRYRVLDNFDLAFSVLTEANKVGAEIQRWTLTEDRFEARLIVPDWRETIGYRDLGQGGGGHQFFKAPSDGQGGSVIIPGLYVSNSETGKGGQVVRPYLLDSVCNNGALIETTLRTVHLGGQVGEGILTREAAEADSRAVWLRVRDVIAAVFDREAFTKTVEQFRKTGEFELGNPLEAVDYVVTNHGLTDEDKQALINELIAPSHGRNANGTVLSLLNAITQRAQAYETSDPEKATELEAIGGRIIANPAQYVVVRK
jgi:hypothetical protein